MAWLLVLALLALAPRMAARHGLTPFLRVHARVQATHSQGPSTTVTTPDQDGSVDTIAIAQSAPATLCTLLPLPPQYIERAQAAPASPPRRSFAPPGEIYLRI